MITQVGSKITKSKWPFATARIAFFVSAWNKEIKFMPILCQIRFVLDDNIAIYINPVRIIKIFYAGSVADGSIENVVTSGCSNSGSSDFQEDDREDFIRILCDLSLKDLDELKMFAPPAAHELNIGLEGTKRFLLRRGRRDLGGENLSRTTRLIGLGLVKEEFSMRNFTGSVEYRSANEIRRAISDYLKQPPTREYELTWFGWRFLQFVSEDSPPTNSDALNITSEANGL